MMPACRLTLADNMIYPVFISAPLAICAGVDLSRSERRVRLATGITKRAGRAARGLTSPELPCRWAPACPSSSSSPRSPAVSE